MRLRLHTCTYVSNKMKITFGKKKILQEKISKLQKQQKISIVIKKSIYENNCKYMANELGGNRSSYSVPFQQRLIVVVPHRTILKNLAEMNKNILALVSLMAYQPLQVI